MYNSALSKYSSISDIAGQAEVENQIAYLEISRANLAAALQRIKQSRAYSNLLLESESLINYLSLAKILTTQAGILEELGEIENAENQYRSALKIYEEHPDVMGEIKTRINFASFYQKQQQNDKAQTILNVVKNLFVTDFKNIKHQYLVVVYNSISRFYKDNGDLTKALEYTQKSLTMAHEIGDKYLEAQALENQNILNSYLNKIDTSQINSPKSIFRKYGNISEELTASLNIYLQLGSKMSQSQLEDTTNYLLERIEDPRVSVIVKKDILLGLQIQDISSKNLISLRNNLRLLLPSFNERLLFSDIGRSHLSLALIEERLGNTSDIEDHLILAEKYSATIPYPKSILFFKKIAFLKFTLNDINGGVNWLFKCINESIGKPNELIINEVTMDLHVINHCWDQLTSIQTKYYLNKIEQLKTNCSIDELVHIYNKFLEGKR